MYKNGKKGYIYTIMNNKIIMEGITFDDVLLLPGYSDFKRKDVDVSVQLHPDIVLKLPVISSPMDTVTESAMSIAIGRAGGLGIIHRNLSTGKEAEMVKNVKKEHVLVGAAVGAGPDMNDRVDALIQAGVDVLVVDSGNGNCSFIIDAVREIKKNYPKIVVMAGNIATADGAKNLVTAGVDIIRVGMGPGSICTTRIVTGMGVPQITAIMEAVKGIAGNNVTIVADGGIRQIGDMAKALGAGADAVMLGGLLAGYDESPGNVIEIQKKKYKSYRGMGSVAAMQQGSAERYGQSKDTVKRKLIPEGVEGLVAYKGSVAGYFDQIAGSLRSSFYDIGARTIDEFHSQAKFIRITPASMAESHPHDILITNPGSNYTK
jgi:IMP dehydrogenase